MFSVNIDASDLEDFGDGIFQATQKALNEAGSQMTQAVRAHILEEAQKKLHSRLDAFVKGIRVSQVDDTWVISLDSKVRWIDDGMNSFSMVPGLLKNNAKVSKDGKKYKVIPFDHSAGRGPTRSTPTQTSLAGALKSELKKRGIPFSKIETNSDGSPKMGKLHSFNINDKPKKTHNGPGQGWGKLGQPLQGKTGIPFLQGVNIYQHETQKADGTKKVSRSIMTFRVVTEDSQAQGKWQHPGLEGVHIFDEAVVWAKHEFDTKVYPKIVQMIASLS